MNCPQCTKQMIKKGIRNSRQRYFCKECGTWHSDVKEATNEMYGRGTGDALFIGDPHEPFGLNGYAEHCARIRDKYNISTVYCLGDLTDQHFGSHHGSDPDGLSGSDEWEQSISKLQKWYNMFPKMKICASNHDSRFMKNAFSNNISNKFMKSFLEVYEAPKEYEYKFFYKHDDIRVFHGTGFSGATGHIRAATKYMQKIVIGHLHSLFALDYMATEDRLIWGMGSGCGIDRSQYSFAYGKDLPSKPIVGCSAVVRAVPMLFPMEL